MLMIKVNKNIVIEDSNKSLDDLIPKVLFSGSANSNITLNDNITNYSYIEIFFGNNSRTSTRTKASNGTTLMLTQEYVSGNTQYTYYAQVELNNNQVIFRVQKRIDKSASNLGIYDSTQLHIFEVLGYK